MLCTAYPKSNSKGTILDALHLVMARKEASIFDEELEYVCDVFSEECKRLDARTIEVALPCFSVLHITIPEFGYPVEVFPEVNLVSAVNVTVLTGLQRAITQQMVNNLEMGSPIISTLIQFAHDEAQRMENELEEAKVRKIASEVAIDANIELERVTAESCAIDIMAGDPITDRKSKFVAHVAKVSSLEDVINVVEVLRRNRVIAAAAHPTIYAYRFRSGSVIFQDSEDDGETGASKKMLFLLDQLHVEGVVVVVTRWFGGILLGPDRFKHIMTCAKQCLVKYGFVSER